MLRQADMTSISQHPSWPTLEAEVEKRVKKIEKIVVAKTLGTGALARIDELELAYYRGMIAGMRWFTAAPPSAERALERFLQAQGLKEVSVGNE